MQEKFNSPLHPRSAYGAERGEPSRSGLTQWRVTQWRVTRCAAFCSILVLAIALPASALRVLTDEAGRKVTLPDHVHRIVCLTPSITDTVYAIGAGADVVGVTDYTLYPPEARQKPSIGGVLRPSLERIAVLHPDVAIGIASFNDAETIRGIERLGIPVFLVNASGLAGLYNSIAAIGRALARESEASALVARLRQREQAVRSQAAAVAQHPSVFLAISLDPCITAGRRAFITELLSAAGARSVTDDLQQEWVHLNIEAIIPRKPAFILVLQDAPFGLQEMREHAGWRSLEAVRRGRVLRIDQRLQYPSPVVFDALEAFAHQLRSAEVR
jgi:ABC-type Fe3+-hydroxamate transport system substrate-binding protein